jgi:hypothetical protein
LHRRAAEIKKEIELLWVHAADLASSALAVNCSPPLAVDHPQLKPATAAPPIRPNAIA